MGVLVVLGVVVLVTITGVVVRAFRGEQPKGGGRRPGSTGTADPGTSSHDSGGSGSGWGWSWGSDSGNSGDSGGGGGDGGGGGGDGGGGGGD